MSERLQLTCGTPSLGIDLTASPLPAWDVPALVAGDDWAARVQVLAPGGEATQDLTGATVVLTVAQEPADGGAVLWTRRSDEVITGTATDQIELDDQTDDEDLDGDEGQGWLTLRAGHQDRADLIDVAGAVRLWELVVELSDGTVYTLARGTIDVLAPLAAAAP
jgi:hypothetical protein